MSDTPRTDAQKRGDFVHINFARELERELNVANNWVEHHQNHCDDLMKENAALRRALADALGTFQHDDEVIVTAERLEAWKAALINGGQL